MDKSKALCDLERQCHNCRRCAIGGKLIQTKKGEFLSNVFSNMCLKARIMVVGQNPGAREVEQGRPFVGPSGTFFDKATKEVLGLDRSSFYITNTVRCFTPGNRRPTDEETSMCRDFLQKEVAVIDPVVIVTLGGPALKQITGQRGITKVHGERLYSPQYGKPVLPLYHTSPLNMRSQEKREEFYRALGKLADLLDG